MQDVEALQQRHRQAESQVDALMQEGQAAQQLLQQAEQRAASAARQVQQQAEQLAALQARLEQVQAQRDAQAQVADDRELQLELARADEARLKAELQGARDGADVLLAQVLAAQSAADSGRAAADQTVSELQAAVDERDAALATTLQRAAAVELLLAQAQADADQARAWHDEERAAAERERAEVQNRIDRLGDELDAARAAAAAMHAAHQGEQAEAQRQRHVLLAGREAQAQVANDRELQLELARADEARLKAELQGARDGADVLLAQVLAAQSAADSGRAAADQTVSELQAAVDERDAALATTLQRAAAVELLLAQAQADADQARAWHDEERAAAERERAEVQNRIDRLGDELDAARAAAAAMHAAHQGEQAEAQRQRHVLTAEREAVAELAALRDKQLKTSGEQIQHLRERMLAAAQEQAHLSRQLDDARSSAQRAHEEQALAAGQMRLMQQALQQHAETARRAGSPPTVQVAAVVAGESRNTPPFRELPFTLTEVSIDEHAIPRLELRLVEHHGNPGLVLLDGPSPGAGLGHWQESGREEGRAYMLLVPADAPARHTLAGLGTHDWRLLEGVVAAIEQALDADEIADAVRWRSTARRLRAQLQETPNRLRYDDLGVSQDPRREGGLLITFRRALFAGRLHPSLTLRWRPGPGDGHADAPLLLLGAADAAQEPPLASWPVGEDGTVAAEWPLPLGTDEATPALRSRWHALPALDRELLFALLDALPAAALRLPAALSGAHPTGPLAADAARWLPLAHQTLDTAGPLPRAARKLRSLMRGVTSA